MREVKNNLQALRQAKGMSRNRLIDETGKCETLLIRIERGADTRISTAMDICRALGCTLNDLYPTPYPEPSEQD